MSGSSWATIGIAGAVCFAAASAWCAAAEPMAEARLPTIALLYDESTPTGPVIEAEVQRRVVDVDWLDRERINEVLKEQRLQAAFADDGVAQRGRLGQLLKCDLLVLVRSSRGIVPVAAGDPQLNDKPPQPPSVLECIISETKLGLRLSTTAHPQEPKPEANAAHVSNAVQESLTKWREGIQQVYAVPPLVSDDLDFRRNYLQTAYAQLVERQLLKLPRTVVIELTEAQAIARELALAGEESQLTRQFQPFFILGRYRHQEEKGSLAVKFQLRLERAAHILRSGDSPQLPVADVPDWITRATKALVKTAGGAPPPAEQAHPQREAAQLAERAEQFVKIAQWGEALGLAEAALLVHPQSPGVRRTAVICCGGLRDEHLRRVMSAGEWGQLAPGLAYYRRGLEHLETLLNAGETWQERIGGGNFLTDFDGPFWASSRLPKDAPPEVHTAMQEMLSLREETYFRIGVRRARERQPDRYWFSWVTFGRPLPERLAVAERMLGALADTPLQTELVSAELTTAVQEMSGKLPPVSDRVASRPEFQSFLAKLERDSAAGQAIARETRRRIADYYEQRDRVYRPSTAPRAADLQAEFQLTPITFRSPTGEPLMDVPRRLVAAGPGVDVALGRYTIYLIKKPPRVELVWQESSPLERVGPCWFDGKYVWCAIDHRTDKPRLLLIDPQQAKVQEFRPPRPLPTHSDQGSGQFQITPSLLGAPLTPGRVLLAGHMGRSWIGIGAVSSSGDHQLEIVYEARTAEVRDRHAKQDAETVFLPLAMFPLLSAATAKKDVLIVRGSPTVLGLEYELPLIFRGDTAKVEPAPPHWNMSGFRGLTTHADQLVFLIYDFQPDPVRIPFFVCGKEPTSRRKLADDVPWGVFVWHEGMLHVVGERWWVWNPVTGKRRELVGEVPFRSERMPSRQRVNASLQSPSEYDWHVNNITSTHHYSVVVTTRNAVLFSAQFPTLGGE